MDEEANASNSPRTDMCGSIPGTSFVRSSELSALATSEPFAEEDDNEKDSIGTCDVPGELEMLPNCAVDREEDGSASICTEDAGDDRPTSMCAVDGGEDRPTSMCTEDAGDDIPTSMSAEDDAEDRPTSICSEGGVTTQVVELSHADEVSCTVGTTPALEGCTPRSGASAEDQRPATYRRRRGGRQWQRAQVAHTAWWNEDAWRHSSEPRYPRGSQWRRTAARAWRPKD